MTRLWPGGEPVQVGLDEAGRPGYFVWQGRVHRVQTIHQRWVVDTDWWSPEGRVWREYLALVTQDGLLCVLYHDRLTGGWRLAKVYD